MVDGPAAFLLRRILMYVCIMHELLSCVCVCVYALGIGDGLHTRGWSALHSALHSTLYWILSVQWAG